LRGEKVGIVVDPVGGGAAQTQPSTSSQPKGQLLIVGHASTNPDEPFTADDLWLRSIGRDRLHRRHLSPGRPPAAPNRQSTPLSRLITDGTLRVPVETPKASRKRRNAHRQLEQRTKHGPADPDHRRRAARSNAASSQRDVSG